MELLLNFPLCGVNCQSQCYCYATHIPERCSSASLLLLHACCSSVLLLCCCSAAQVQLVWLCNHWVRLHCCTLPVLLLKPLLWLSLAWVEEFKLSLSLELAWLGHLGLGTLAWWKYPEYSTNFPPLC